MSERLAGQVALITGGASGLGAAVVARFLDEGCVGIGVLDRSREDLDRLEEKFGDRIVTTHGDVRSWADHRTSVERTLIAFARLDCYIGNAGIWESQQLAYGYRR